MTDERPCNYTGFFPMEGTIQQEKPVEVIGKKMVEQELREKIASYLTSQFIGNPKDFPDDESLLEADQILALIKEAGYVSPEECKQCQSRQVEADRILNREAAYVERQLMDEVKDWKQRYYEVGGR